MKAARHCMPLAGSLFIVVFSGLWALAAEAAPRTWTDSTGKHKMKATFVSLDDSKVTLEKDDGETIEIDLKKLSKADQKYVADAVAAADDSPFKSKTDSPFKAAPPKTTRPKTTRPKATPPRKKPGSRQAASAEPASTSEPRIIEVDYSSTALITLANTETWQVEAPEFSDTFASKPKTAPLPTKTNFFEGLKGIAVNPVAGKAAVAFNFDQPKPTGSTRVVLCDLATGKTTPPASAAVQMVPLAVHDDGKQIVMRRDEFGFGNLDRLELWTLKGSRPERAVSWIPYADAQHGGRDVMWAEFLDENRLATSSRGGKVVVWSFPDLEPLSSFTLADGAVPALSPDRTQIAYCNGKEVGIFDVTSGEVIAQQATPENLVFPKMLFSPSGKKLAAVGRDKLVVWDAANGGMERSISLAGIIVTEGSEFPDDNFVLVNGHILIDLENQLKLWTYEGQQKVACRGGWAFLGVSDGEQKPGALVAAQLPHAAAKTMLKQALTQPDLFVLHSGSTVKVNVDGVPDFAERERVRKALTDRLQTIDCQAGDNGAIELVATMEGPKDRQVRYMFGGGDYQVKEYIARLKFVYQGQTAWERSGSNVPGVMTLKKGENVADKLRASEKPDYGFFDHVLLPKFLQKPAAGKGPGGSLTLGQSSVTTAGLR